MNGLNCWPSDYSQGGSGYIDLNGAKMDPDDAPELDADYFERADVYVGERLVRRASFGETIVVDSVVGGPGGAKASGYTVELPATVVDDIKSAFDSMVNLIPLGPNLTVMKNLTGATERMIASFQCSGCGHEYWRDPTLLPVCHGCYKDTILCKQVRTHRTP